MDKLKAKIDFYSLKLQRGKIEAIWTALREQKPLASEEELTFNVLLVLHFGHYEIITEDTNGTTHTGSNETGPAVGEGLSEDHIRLKHYKDKYSEKLPEGQKGVGQDGNGSNQASGAGEGVASTVPADAQTNPGGTTVG